MKKLLASLLLTLVFVNPSFAAWTGPVVDVDQFDDSVNRQYRIVSTDGSMTLILNYTNYKATPGKPATLNSYLSLQSNTSRFRANQHNDGGIYSRIRVDNNPVIDNVRLSFFSNTLQAVSILPTSGYVVDNPFVQNIVKAKQRILIEIYTPRVGNGNIIDSEIIEFRI